MSMGVRINFSRGEAKTKLCFGLSFRLVDDATKIDVHKALHSFYTTEKMPKVIATVANRVSL